MAFGETDSILTLLIYFPCVFFLREGVIHWGKLVKLVYAVVLVLAGLHIILYIGQSINPSFCDMFFDTLHKLSFNTSDKPLIMMGHGYVRIIYPTSIFLLMGIYFYLRRFDIMKIKDYIGFGVVIFSALCTATRSIWFGMVAGGLVFFACILFTKRDKSTLIKISKIVAFSLIIIVVADFTVFHGLLSVRIRNSFITGQSPSTTQIEENSVAGKDKAGTIISNNLKSKQTATLLTKWKESPLIGFGYGSYVEDDTRSGPTPFSYEMFLPAMLMKLGVIGLATWACFALFMLMYAVKMLIMDKVELFAWLALAISLGTAIQTNPMLLNFCGMSIFVFLLLAEGRILIKNDNDKLTLEEQKL